MTEALCVYWAPFLPGLLHQEWFLESRLPSSPNSQGGFYWVRGRGRLNARIPEAKVGRKCSVYAPTCLITSSIAFHGLPWLDLHFVELFKEYTKRQMVGAGSLSQFCFAFHYFPLPK